MSLPTDLRESKKPIIEPTKTERLRTTTNPAKQYTDLSNQIIHGFRYAPTLDVCINECRTDLSFYRTRPAASQQYQTLCKHDPPKPFSCLIRQPRFVQRPWKNSALARLGKAMTYSNSAQNSRRVMRGSSSRSRRVFCSAVYIFASIKAQKLCLV